MPRFDPETMSPRDVALRGVGPARWVVLPGGLAVLGVTIAALLGLLPAGAPGARLVAAMTLVALAASLAVLTPSRAACAVRRAAMGTLFQLGLLAALCLLTTGQ